MVVLGCVANEGYVNRPEEVEEFCIFNRSQSACSSAVAVGTLCFLCSSAFLLLDVYFPQISGVKDRKKAVMADILVSGGTPPPPGNCHLYLQGVPPDRMTVTCVQLSGPWSGSWTFASWPISGSGPSRRTIL